MKAHLSVQMFCECNGAMEHHGEYARCINANCEHFGKLWAVPTFNLKPYVPPDDKQTTVAEK